MERMMYNDDLAATITGVFLSDMPRQLDALDAALKSADPAAVRLCAHTVKGVAANVGGNRFRAVAADMENAAKNQNVPAAAARMPDLRREFDALARAILQKRPDAASFSPMT